MQVVLWRLRRSSEMSIQVKIEDGNLVYAYLEFMY